MGGLARHMPATAFHFLVGALAISALPPLNGFVSEWLTFQTALQAPLLEHSVVRSLRAALRRDAGARRCAYRDVLRQGLRGRFSRPAHAVERPPSGDAGLSERLGFAWLSAGCLVLGLFPAAMLHLLNQVGFSLTGHGLSPEALESNWLWLVPTHPAQASYSPLIFLLVVLGVVLLTIRLVRVFYHGRVRRADPWDCGFPEQTSRMQDSADAFGQPIGLVFGPLYLLKRSLPAPEDAAPKYSAPGRATGTGTGSICRSRSWSSSCRRKSACCSAAASASTCCTASSP